MENLIENIEQPTNVDNIKKYVKDYLELDREIAKLKLAIKDRNEKKKIISEEILSFMKNFNIDDMNFSYGKLSYKTGVRKKSLNKSNLLDSYKEFFNGDSDKAKELIDFIENKKETTEVVNLKKSIIDPIKSNSIKIDSI